jgi:AhpD family alkylhydroperoxidase
MDIKIYDETTAPEAARETLQAMRDSRGFITNLSGVMAGAPALLKGYVELGNAFNETSFTMTERQVVLLAASHENVCHYCMAGHSTAAAAAEVPQAVVDAIRNDEVIADVKLEALRKLTTAVVESRGWPAAVVVDQFLSVGYGQQQLLEVVLGVGVKTLSNYVNHIAETPVNEQFAANRWAPPLDVDSNS